MKSLSHNSHPQSLVPSPYTAAVGFHDELWTGCEDTDFTALKDAARCQALALQTCSASSSSQARNKWDPEEDQPKQYLLLANVLVVAGAASKGGY